MKLVLMTFIYSNIAQLLSFQHVINIFKLLGRYFTFSFLYRAFRIWCVLHLEPVSIQNSPFQVLSGHVWLVAAPVEMAALDGKNAKHSKCI